jgi:hypothetical protein
MPPPPPLLRNSGGLMADVEVPMTASIRAAEMAL